MRELVATDLATGYALSYSDMERLDTMLKFRMIEPPYEPWRGQKLVYPRRTGRAL